MKNTWEIIDENGVLHSGTAEEMNHAFDVMTNSDEYSKEEIDTFFTNWKGDLKLVEVHYIHR